MKIKIKIALSLILVVFLSNFVCAQDYETRYNSGKKFLEMGKYQPAMEAFKPLLSNTEGDKVPYTYYFYALAAFKSGKTEEAKQITKQLQLKFPNWEKKEETAYLLGNILFEQGKYKEALEALAPIKKKELKKDVQEMKLHYLSTMDNMESLEWLQKTYPKDKELALVLAQKLSFFCRDEKDKMLLAYLQEEFRFNDADLNVKVYKSTKKEQYNVGVLFPFMTATLPVENVNRPNQFLLDMYQGIRVAVDSLRKEGLNITLHAFDTEKDVEKFKSLLEHSEIKNMDLIIGPIYPAHLPVLADFAKAHEIEAISPFSTDTTLTQNNPFFILFKANLKFQAEAVADYIKKNRQPKEQVVHSLNEDIPDKKVLNDKLVIFYSDTEQDSLLATAYKNTMVSPDTIGYIDTTFKIKVFEKITRENISRIKEVLADSSTMEDVNAIFIASSDQIIAANVISSTEISGFDIPIFTTSDWLDFKLITIEQMERRKIHFLYPGYLNFDNPKIKIFKDKYMDLSHRYPTTFAFQGYDMMYLFGKMLQENGTFFTKELKSRGFIPGQNFIGVDYTGSQDNTFVPIVKFKNGKLIPVNMPNKLYEK